MNNYILISRTYAQITPESAEDGDFSGTGFLSECEQVSFSELVKLMKRHYRPSQSPNDYSTHVWYSTDFEIEDYATMAECEESIHFHRDNTANAAKYWKWAAKMAGL